MSPSPEVHAIVLSGGGAYGAYEIGLMKSLFSGQASICQVIPCPIVPEIFTGTSVGAYNAAFLASQPHPDALQSLMALEEIWLNRVARSPDACENGVFRVRLNPFELVNPRCTFSNPIQTLANMASDVSFFANDLFLRGMQFAEGGGSVQSRVLNTLDISSLFVVEPLISLIQSTIPLSQLRSSAIKLKVAATNWSTGDLKLFGNQEMSDVYGHTYIAASAAVPGIFPPVEIQGEIYVDGGVLMNTPLKPAIDLGATTLHVIYMDPDVAKAPTQTLRSTINSFDRYVLVQNANRLNAACREAERVNLGLRILKAGQARNQAEGNASVILQSAGLFIEHDQKAGSPFRPLTIHRYHPREDLGGNAGLLDMQLSHIQELIAKGFDDGLHHNCDESECVLVDKTN